MAAQPIVATFTSTPRLALRSYRACHRAAHVFNRLAAGALLASGLLTAAAGAADGAVYVPGLVIAMAGLVIFLLQRALVRRQLADHLAGPAEVTVTMTDTEYQVRGPGVSRAKAWGTFRRVRRVGDFWILRVNPAAAMALPASALDERQTAAFVSLMESKGLLRPGRRFTRAT
ncbi:hypothetical protein ACL02R_08875 [Streptomyces sp. MS19]|uniref:hypothetical protein n=1 Tax=Streptomyces sp. MS19 TaxID=3385972 RepID=UPI0039A29B51